MLIIPEKKNQNTKHLSLSEVHLRPFLWWLACFTEMAITKIKIVQAKNHLSTSEGPFLGGWYVLLKQPFFKFKLMHLCVEKKNPVTVAK